MSLQVWLPLTKDLRQQGLSDVTVTNNGATFDSAGKLGGCYSFDGSNDNFSYTPNVDGLETFSIALWLCPTASTPVGAFFSLERDTYWQLTFNGANIGIRDNSIGWNGTRKNYSSGTYTANVWTHLAVTYNKGVLKIYRDSNLLSTNTVGGTKLNTGINNARVGSAVQSGYYYNGKLNDVRFYDHCLSEMEVKQLSQGLILHYPLSDNSIQQLNNCYTNPTFNSSSAGAGWSHWGSSGHKGTYGQNTDSNYIYREGQPYSHWVADEADATKNFLVYQSPAFEGGQRSLQCICKEENSLPIDESIVFPDWNARSGGTIAGKWTSITSLGNGFYHCKCEDIQQSGSDDLIGFYVRPGYKVYFSEAYVENDRECCSDIFYPTNVVYDTTGFCNNGSSIGTFIISSDTPKYSVSTQFSGTQYIQLPFPCSAISEAVSVAVWGYESDWNTSSAERLIGAATNSSGWCIGDYGSENTLFAFYANGGYNAATGFKQLSAGWHHFVITFDGLHLNYYVDGQPFSSKTFSTKQTATGNYNIEIGRHYGDGCNFKGRMSDARIYATALSADDVKSLYQNCATIDPDGTIRGQIRS